jgi:hypothetical protein
MQGILEKTLNLEVAVVVGVCAAVFALVLFKAKQGWFSEWKRRGFLGYLALWCCCYVFLMILRIATDAWFAWTR